MGRHTFASRCCSDGRQCMFTPLSEVLVEVHIFFVSEARSWYKQWGRSSRAFVALMRGEDGELWSFWGYICIFGFFG